MNFKYINFPFYKNDKDSLLIPSTATKEHRSNIVIIKEIENNETNLTLLSKILAAIGLDIEQDCLLVTLSEHVSGNLHELCSSTERFQFFIFGINATRLNLQIKTLVYQPIEIQNFNIIFAHPLLELNTNTDLKKKLWASLKKIEIQK